MICFCFIYTFSEVFYFLVQQYKILSETVMSQADYFHIMADNQKMANSAVLKILCVCIYILIIKDEK